MSIVIKILRLLILVFSFYGYIQFFRKRVKLEFSIGIIFCSIGSAMFFAGILNIMKETAIIICLFGLVLAVQSVYKKEKLQKVICTGTIFFGVSCVLLFILLYGSKFVGYSDFSHWGVASRVLLQENRFPNFMDADIDFQSYPLGNVSFIYYIAKIVGVHSEWMQAFIQAMLMMGILTSLFAFAKKRSTKILLIFSNIMLLASNTALVDLLVDTLLPVTAIGGIAVCIYYKNQLRDKIWWSVPYTCFLIAIKNSGLFFVIAILGYAFLFMRTNVSSFKIWLYNLLIPLGTLILWQKHVKLVFVNGMMAKHSMSLGNFEHIFEAKGWESITTIANGILKNTFSITNRFLIVLIFLIILYVYARRTNREMIPKEIIGTIFITYIVYQISLFGMYLFTMPSDEAIRLAEYRRYHLTCLIYVTGILLISFVQMIETNRNIEKRKWIPGILSVICCGCVFLAVTPNLEYYTRQNLEGTDRERYDQFLGKYVIQSSKTCLVIKENGYADGGYLDYMLEYLFDATDVVVVSVSDIQEKEILVDNYDYIIIDSESEEVIKYANKCFPEKTWDSIPFLVREKIL